MPQDFSREDFFMQRRDFLQLGALAALGGALDSVQADQAHIKGALRVTSNSGFTVHEISTAHGTSVREYTGPGGTVFAVAWDGPVNPDFEQLFGSSRTGDGAAVLEHDAETVLARGNAASGETVDGEIDGNRTRMENVQGPEIEGTAGQIHPGGRRRLDEFGHRPNSNL